jgi:protein-L-isoaspartate(D-aspartate) O-methyltransferase
MSLDPSRLMQYVLALRQSGVTQPALLAAMERAPRSAFAPPAFMGPALEDLAIPLGDGEVMDRAVEVAERLLWLGPRPSDKVLEIGAGTGFLTAILSHLCKRVVAVERRLDLVSQARASIGALRIMNAHIHHGDGLLGWPEDAPFDRIVLGGAAPPFIPRLIAQLAPGGWLLAPTGLGAQVRWRLFEKLGDVLQERADFGPAQARPLAPGLSAGLEGAG